MSEKEILVKKETFQKLRSLIARFYCCEFLEIF